MKTHTIAAVALVALTACAEPEQPPPMTPQPPPPAAMPPAPVVTTPPAAAPAPAEMTITSKSPEAVETFRKGRDLFENIRIAEAAEAFKKAVQVDPQFAQAFAYLGLTTPDADGVKFVDQAVSLSKALPEPERLAIESIAAAKRGDSAKSLELDQKIAALLPNDWRSHFVVGAALNAQRKGDEAIIELKKAVALNPNAGPAYNQLGYIATQRGESEQAIAAFKKYTEVSPAEPNAHDSLADAYLSASKLEDAEASYRKAISLSSSFFLSWQGVAQTKFLRGDWNAGREALAKAKESAPRPIDKAEIEEHVGWSFLSEGKSADALKTFEALEKSAGDQKIAVHQTVAALNHAFALVDGGRAAEAVKQVDSALERADKAGLAGDELDWLKRRGSLTKILAQTKLGKAPDAQKTVLVLEELAKKNPGAHAQSALHFGRGMAIWAGGDAKAAAAELSQCLSDDTLCRWQLALAQDKAGDKPAAEATRAKIVAIQFREPDYLFVHTKIAGKAPAKAASAPASDKKQAPADKPAPEKAPAKK